MNKSFDIFKKNIANARLQTGIYDYLKSTVVVADFDDLLRAQIVYSVSAFDKLIHDIVRVGMVDTYLGRRPATARFRGESITIDLHGALVSATLPPAEVLFETEIVRKLGILSFQDPGKVAEGLSLIWSEEHKWQKIATKMGITVSDAKTTLKLISTRRNAIVHEADIDPLTDGRRSVARKEAIDTTDFLEKCGAAIVELVM